MSRNRLPRARTQTRALILDLTFRVLGQNSDARFQEENEPETPTLEADDVGPITPDSLWVVLESRVPLRVLFFIGVPHYIGDLKPSASTLRPKKGP